MKTVLGKRLNLILIFLIKSASFTKEEKWRRQKKKLRLRKRTMSLMFRCGFVI